MLMPSSRNQDELLIAQLPRSVSLEFRIMCYAQLQEVVLFGCCCWSGTGVSVCFNEMACGMGRQCYKKACWLAEQDDMESWAGAHVLLGRSTWPINGGMSSDWTRTHASLMNQGACLLNNRKTCMYSWTTRRRVLPKQKKKYAIVFETIPTATNKTTK